MRSRPVASDNLGGTRQDAQANLYNPVLESHLEEKQRYTACAQRIKYGDIFLLLHLLGPWLKVEDAVRNFPDFYLYAGFDCTNKWANFLGGEARKEALTARLQEAFGVTDTEILSCQEKVTTKQWSSANVLKHLKIAFLAKTLKRLAA